MFEILKLYIIGEIYCVLGLSLYMDFLAPIDEDVDLDLTVE